ncbi:MAG TPA: putative methyltransferase [Candidatus Atribacteria bacterium]|nr:putative methyltransferase [Candidatus Atribacteria bacterium]
MENKEDLKKYIMLNILRGIDSFDKLLQICHGIYPTELRRLLNELKNEGLIKEENNLFVVDKNYIKSLSIINVNTLNIEEINKEFSKLYYELPTPHPIDYEWRWDLNSVENLFKAIINEKPFNNLKIAFLGAPTAAIYFSIAKKLENLDLELTLIDRNEEIIRYINNHKILNSQIKTILHDLQYDFRNQLGKFDVIVMDPPWYEDFYKVFISRASTILQPESGLIYSSLFPINTRPNAVYERIEILEIFTKSGLSVLSLTPSFFKYETPHFESKSLAVSNVKLENNWRYGDLVILQSWDAPKFWTLLVLGGRYNDPLTWTSPMLGLKNLLFSAFFPYFLWCFISKCTV